MVGELCCEVAQDVRKLVHETRVQVVERVEDAEIVDLFVVDKFSVQ